jgi:hypothetical protein
MQKLAAIHRNEPSERVEVMIEQLLAELRRQGSLQS